jgi:ribose transport system permease protein
MSQPAPGGHTVKSVAPTTQPSRPPSGKGATPATGRHPALRYFSLRRLGGIYALAALVGLFTLIDSSGFPTSTTFTLILSTQAVTGILALGALVPLAAGCLDLSFASIAGFAAVSGAWLSANTGINDAVIVLIVIGCSMGFGLISGAMVAGWRLNSLIVTLGVASVATGVTEYIANGLTMTVGFGTTLTNVGQGGIGIVPYMAILMLILAAVLYVWMEHTVSGRFVLATGSNVAAARLNGIRVGRLQLLTLVTGAGIYGVAGLLVDASIGSVSEVTTSGYLLPAIAALFLGSTMVKTRANVLGTVIAIYVLGVGIKGLQLLGAADWVNDFFNGAVLLVAITLSMRERRSKMRAKTAGTATAATQELRGSE